jgi:outer membrane protein assembly factor BamB
MAQIEIRHLSGSVEMRPLNRATPLSIGSHSSNNICIDEEGVAVLHCRISWSGKSYEVMCGGADGVDVNGQMVQHATLKDGDLLRIGSVDLVFRGRKRTSAPAPPEEESIGLQQVTDDEIPILKRATDVAREMGGSSGPLKPDVAEPRRESFPQTKKPHPKPASIPSPSTTDEDDEDLDELFAAAQDEGAEKSKQSAVARLKGRLAGAPARPGEQDVARSPLVLMLGGGAIALLLAAVTVWFIIGRETAQKHYAAAQQEMNEGNYQQAAALFESFVQEHPRHQQAENARYGLGMAKIQMALAGATPNWPRGLEELQSFIKQNRDRPNYGSQVESLRKTAANVAFGAAKSVESLSKRRRAQPAALNDLLDVSRSAATVLGRLYPPDEQPTELNSRLADAHWKAEQAIATRKFFLATVTEMEQALKVKRPDQALAARKKLVTSHAVFRNDRQLNQLLQATLDLENSQVVVEDVNQPAVTTDHEQNAEEPLTLIRHTYSGTGEASVGRTVFAVAKDCCYGIDSVTGQPLWRRVVGQDIPFFPIPVETSISGVLLFDTNRNELLLLERRTGKLAWRQPLGEPLGGEPLLHEGRAYAVTAQGRLYQVVLDTGLATRRLSFSQPLVARPVLVRNETQLVVAGHASMLYTLSVRPLSPLAVSFSDHSAGSIAAPLLTMGSLVLLTENNAINNSRLRVFDTRTDEETLKEIATESVTGRIRNRPVIRGRQLFVTSTPERITAFSVSEDKEQPPLLRITETRITGGHSGPLFLKAGADGLLWMAGSAFRSFRLLTDSIAYDEAKRIAVGIATQPLQQVDRYFYTGRRQPYHRAVLFTPVEREQLTSHWGTLCGAATIAMLVSNNQIVCVTETGDVYRIDSNSTTSGRFVTQPTTTLPIPDTSAAPLMATQLTDQLLAVSSGLPEPKLWLIDQNGRVVRETVLPDPLETAPVALKTGVVLALPGRLKILLPDGGSPPEDYPAPLVQGKQPRWRHLLALDDDELLAINDVGDLSRIQLRQGDVPHLAVVDSIDLPQPVDVAPVVADGHVFLADASGKLTMLDASSLEVLSTVKLPVPASNQLRYADGRLFVEDREHLREYRIENGQLTSAWTFPLEGRTVIGTPLVRSDGLVVSLTDGTILWFTSQSRKVLSRIDVGQPLAGGLQSAGDLLIAPTIDGSLRRVAPVKLHN